MTRKDLAKQFADLGFTRGAEIGVERGVFSEVLCRSIPGLVLVAVDAWSTKPGYREHVSQQELDRFEAETRKRLRPYVANVIKGFSADVAQSVPDGSLDFAYIDADHCAEEASADIRAWTPKVRSGGVVSGHDYQLPGVNAAVWRWCENPIETTQERSPSWWWVRP